MYLDAFRIHVTISPTARLSAGPIDQVQPWVEHNGKLAGVGDAYGLSVYLGPPLGLPAFSIPWAWTTIEHPAAGSARYARRGCILPASIAALCVSSHEMCSPPRARGHCLQDEGGWGFSSVAQHSTARHGTAKCLALWPLIRPISHPFLLPCSSPPALLLIRISEVRVFKTLRELNFQFC